MFERYTSKLLLSPKTSIGDYVFDVYTNINHSQTATITSHPTQFGANISDHKFDEPDQLTFQIGMSDSSQDLIKGQFYQQGHSPIMRKIKLDEKGELVQETYQEKYQRYKENALNFLSDSRSVNAFNILSRLKLEGVPLKCVTRLRTYDNMIINSISVDDSNETKYGLRATVTLKEILTATLSVVQVKSTVQTVQSTAKGSTNALDFDLTSKAEYTSTLYDKWGMYVPKS